MIRLIGIFVGLGFTAAVVWAFGWGAAAVIGQGYLVEETAEHEFHEHPKAVSFAHDGAFGKWDFQQLQRGHQVYKEVCSACHTQEFVAIREHGQLRNNKAKEKAEATKRTVSGNNTY